MSDRQWKRLLRRYKDTPRRERWPQDSPLWHIPVANTETHLNRLDARRCLLHPRARFAICDHVQRIRFYPHRKYRAFRPRGQQHATWAYNIRFCTGCYGSTCPVCGYQVRIKELHKTGDKLR